MSRTDSGRFPFAIPFWAGIAFAGFLGIFALDSFDGAPLARALPAFAIHLIPSYLVLGAVFTARNRERLGGLLMLSLAVIYIGMSWGRFNATALASIAGPPTVIGLMFLLRARPARATS